jgi:hypothetical protein
MHERVGAETPESPEPAAVALPRQGAVVERMLALQRTAGNAAVTRLLARQPTAEGPMDIKPTEFVFILGAKDDAALESAKQHYRSVLASKMHRRVITRDEMSDATLSGVFAYLSQVKHPISEITLVVHGTGDGTLTVPLNSADKDDRTSPDELEKAINDGVLTPLSDGQITSKTRIRLQACFTGVRPRMVNLLDKAFGEGWGTVIAPTVEVGYAKNIWHDEGLTGWWVTSPHELNQDELALALKTKYGASVKLDLTQYQENTDTHHKGEYMKDDDEMWAELARKPEKVTETDQDGKKSFIYIANAFVQGVKPGYEDNPLLYTKSSYHYMPEEL